MVAKADWLRSSVLVILPDAGGVTFPITRQKLPLPPSVSLLIQGFESQRLFQTVIRKNQIDKSFGMVHSVGITSELPKYRKEGVLYEEDESSDFS